MAAGNRPTPEQMTLLRRLAAERGQTFAYPSTAREASREIRRLLKTLAIFPKSVAIAEQLERENVRHVHAHYASFPATMALIIPKRIADRTKPSLGTSSNGKSRDAPSAPR